MIELGYHATTFIYSFGMDLGQRRSASYVEKWSDGKLKLYELDPFFALFCGRDKCLIEVPDDDE